MTRPPLPELTHLLAGILDERVRPFLDAVPDHLAPQVHPTPAGDGYQVVAPVPGTDAAVVTITRYAIVVTLPRNPNPGSAGRWAGPASHVYTDAVDPARVARHLHVLYTPEAAA